MYKNLFDTEFKCLMTVVKGRKCFKGGHFLNLPEPQQSLIEDVLNWYLRNGSDDDKEYVKNIYVQIDIFRLFKSNDYKEPSSQWGIDFKNFFFENLNSEIPNEVKEFVNKLITNNPELYNAHKIEYNFRRQALNAINNHNQSRNSNRTRCRIM